MSVLVRFFLQIWHRWQQSHARRIGRHTDKREEQGLRQQWFLLTGSASQSAMIRCPDVEALKPVYPPDNAFWADPFVWVRDGRRYVFFEDLPFNTSRGRISVIEVDEAGTQIGESIPVLDLPHHLSYPFLFEHEGELYMMPEQTEVKRLDLYRCTQFPHQWVFEKTLIDGMKIADATLFEHDGRWWIFCAAKKGKIRINESLFAFHADSPLSTDWTPHSANPLVRDLRFGRQGGRIFRDESGKLFRPSQNCLRRYGHGLNLSEIQVLTPLEYKESLVWNVSGDEIGMRAVHHLDWRAGLVVMDAQRLVPQTAMNSKR